ncbi:MAG TPA: hypothetical protein VHE30_08790 [Polyangiaceae bacterium]|nr:hypothetical protein [Polyangiaceae bacterium]
MSVRRQIVPLSTLLGVALTACLPKDTRPVPARVDVTLSLSSGGVRVGTVDGWTVTLERGLLGIRSSLRGDACADYAPEGYTRIVDPFLDGHQKVNTLYSLGHCDIGFSVQSPSVDPYTPLGEHVTPADHAFMNVPGLDPYTVTSGKPVATGVAFHVTGRAVRGAQTKTFAWSFRQRTSSSRCAAPLDEREDAGPLRDARASDHGGPVDGGDAGSIPFYSDAGPPGPRGLDLTSAGDVRADLVVHPETLFLDSTNLAVASPRFDVLALADDRYGNGDGEVTIGELGLVPLEEVGGRGRYQQPPPLAEPPPATWKTLEDFVYLGLYPRVVRYRDRGVCDVTIGGGR